MRALYGRARASRVRASKDRRLETPGAYSGRGLKMRFSLAVAIVLAGISVSGLAQETFKVKRSAPEKAPRKSAPVGKTASPVASNGTSKELQTLERQTAKSSAPARGITGEASNATIIRISS